MPQDNKSGDKSQEWLSKVASNNNNNIKAYSLKEVFAVELRISYEYDYCFMFFLLFSAWLLEANTHTHIYTRTYARTYTRTHARIMFCFAPQNIVDFLQIIKMQSEDDGYIRAKQDILSEHNKR